MSVERGAEAAAAEAAAAEAARRVEALDWAALERELEAQGCAMTPALLPAEQCREIAAMYAAPDGEDGGGPGSVADADAGSDADPDPDPDPDPVADPDSDPDPDSGSDSAAAARSARSAHSALSARSPSSSPAAVRFRSRVVMARHGFGRGEYRYFAYPLPPLVAALRAAFYPRLAPLANRWNEAMGIAVRYPDEHAEFLARCHAAGQVRPTPLLLQYGAGDYNCLHQDLYGEHVFPLQVAVLLSEPGRDFTGGELVLTEQRPRMQSRPMVLALAQGQAAIFAVHHRPVAGTRGSYRVQLRHGVSRLHSGHRHTLGLIFHDAQ